jgi:hypothetical protein
MRVAFARRITIATVFGLLVFASKILIPTPFDKMAVAPQAVPLTLGFLLIGPLGATYVATFGFLDGFLDEPRMEIRSEILLELESLQDEVKRVR